MGNNYSRFICLLLLVCLSISSCKDSASGPEQPEKPDPIELEITSIEPTEGTEGTQVTIKGKGFSSTPGSNRVTFNGVEANVTAASTTELETTVPQGATTGQVRVAVDGETATGPQFELITTGILEIMAFTNRPELEPDGYAIFLSGTEEGRVEPSGTLFLELEANTYDVEIGDFINFCDPISERSHTVDITAGDTTSIDFEVECQPVLNDQIVYNRVEINNELHLYVMDSDGSNQLQITEDNVSSLPDISPDGKKIAFTRDTDIYIVNVDGSNLINLTNSPETDKSPDWSPDGKKLAFASNIGTHGDRKIVTLNSDGTGLKISTDVDTGDDDFFPSWSPDGKKIVFYRSRKGINVINADGSNPEQLTDSSGYSPLWSPDGNHIAFVEGGEVFVMDTDGSNQKIIENIQTDIVQGVAWSPDGTKMVYYHQDSGLFTVNSDGTNKVKLLENDGGPLLHVYPDWGPQN